MGVFYYLCDMETAQTKCCSKCKVEKPVSEFSFDNRKDEKRRSKDGFRGACKSCESERGKIYRMKNLDKERERARNYHKNNPEKSKEQKEQFLSNNPTYHTEYRKTYKPIRNEKEKQRREDNPLVKLYQNLQGYINKTLSGKYKRSQKTEQILGCSIEYFKTYIENQFEPGMTWENWGLDTWHIDHIKPKSWAKTEEEVYAVNHYTNLKPLWAKENLRKNNRYEG